jgi:hypothetical protein
MIRIAIAEAAFDAVVVALRGPGESYSDGSSRSRPKGL